MLKYHCLTPVLPKTSPYLARAAFYCLRGNGNRIIGPWECLQCLHGVTPMETSVSPRGLVGCVLDACCAGRVLTGCWLLPGHHAVPLSFLMKQGCVQSSHLPAHAIHSPFTWGSSEPVVLSCCPSSSCATMAGRTSVLQPPKSLARPGGWSPSPRRMVQPSRSPCRPQIQPDCKLHNLASGCFRNRSAFSLN